MKKILKTLALATLGIFALASCEDVPAPYVVPGSGNGSNGTPNADYIINQTFSSSLGTFQSESESGQIAWKGDSRYGAVVSGYDDWDGSGTKTNQAGVTYLVSPEIDLTDVDSAYVTIEQAINYAKSTLAEDNKLMIRVGNGEWVELPMNYNGLGSSFTYTTQDIQIPQEYMGKKVQLGLKHTAHDTYSSTWEVKSLSVSKGQAPVEEAPTGKEVTCAEAVELTNALADGATSTETYTVTGYITEVVGAVSNNQQTFWMADAKGGGRVFEAYYANLPEGVTEFKAGAKVKITGSLTKYVNKNSGQVTAEIKNATVEILEDGEGGETPAGTEVTCAQAVELTNALEDGATSAEVYSVTGYITEVVGNVSKNQQTFWMADTKDGGKVFEAFYANLPEGVTEFKAGMKVKITGNLMKYVKNEQVTPEIKNATVEILENGEGGETPAGTEVTCAQAVELTNALEDGATSAEVYSVTGYITEVVGNVSKNQQTFWMADTKDGGKVFEAFYANLPEGVTEFKAGMKVKITGNLMKFVKNEQVTPEIKNATVEILENGGDTPTPTIEGGTIEDPYTVEEALQIINDGTYTSAKVYVTGKISEIKEINTEYGNATYFISDDGTKTTQLQVFRGTSLGGEKFQETDELAVGDKVTVYGILTMYQNTTPEITGSQLYELNGEIAGGGNGGNGGNDGDATSITFSDKGYTNAQDFEGKDITVGEAKLTWSKGTGSTTPKYYDTGAAMRLYGGNTLTISSSKSISKVVFTYNGADYTPTSESATATPGSYDFSTHTWTGNATSVVLKNTASKGHFRIVSVSITYAE